MTRHTFPSPRGWYLAHEVGQLVGVSGDRIGQWARRGYIRSSHSDGRPRVYSFQDLTAAPLATTTDSGRKGRRRVILRLEDANLDIGHSHGRQTILEYSLLQDITGLLRRGGWAIRDQPGIEHIQVDPDRLSGRPTIRDRRIAASKVAELARSGFSGLRALREDYELGRSEIEDAVRWHDQVLQYDQAA